LRLFQSSWSVNVSEETGAAENSNFLSMLINMAGELWAQRRYGCRTMMLETVAVVPGMVGGMLLHLRSLRRFEHSGGWIRVLLEEAENERMHLMT
jgi:ubiquinol oxidase